MRLKKDGKEGLFVLILLFILSAFCCRAFMLSLNDGLSAYHSVPVIQCRVKYVVFCP